MFLLRGIEFTYEAVRDWEAKLPPSLIDNLRRRRGDGSRVRRSWYVDETYIKVNGRWCYLYRAIQRPGALVDVMLSETRDMAAAEKFFRSAKAVTSALDSNIRTMQAIFRAWQGLRRWLRSRRMGVVLHFAQRGKSSGRPAG